MKDKFGIEAKILDHIAFVPHKRKEIAIGVIVGFGKQFGKPCLLIDSEECHFKNRPLQSEFVIVLRKNNELENLAINFCNNLTE